MDPSETSRDENPGSESSIDYNRPADNPSGRSLEALLDEVDAETLDQRRHAHSTSDPRERERCPACGSVKLHRKTGGPCGTRKPGDYRCDGCNHHFDEPVVDDETADAVTDSGEARSESLKTALENADCHPDMVRYAEKAAERGRTPILNSLRRFHDVSDVSRIKTVGTQLERSLWKDGAEATLRRHGHVDETNAEILQEIVEQQPVSDGGHPPGHSPEPSVSPTSAAEYYVVDETRAAVVDGPLPMAHAKDLANEHGPDHVVASRDTIQLLETAGDTTVRWETDEDVDVVTDGGFAPCPRCDTDLLVQQSITVEEDWWCHGCDRHFSSDDPPGGVTIRTDGGQPAGLDEVELRIRTARANIAGLIPIFGMGVQAAQDGGALKGRAAQFVSQIYDKLESEYPEADRREDLLDTVSHTSQHGGSWVPLEVSIDDVDEDADGAFEEVR
jgi:transposase-like protein